MSTILSLPWASPQRKPRTAPTRKDLSSSEAGSKSVLKVHATLPMSTNRKVKFKLEQPDIMCSGRSRVQGYFRGKVLNENSLGMEVEITSRGDKVTIFYDKTEEQVLTHGFEDLKLIE